MDDVSRTIGSQIRALRRHFDRKQEDIAAAANRWGLGWTRATVAAIESGRRAISLEEFILLPLVLAAAIPSVDSVELRDLLTKDRLIQLTPEVSLTGSEVEGILEGHAGEIGRDLRPVAWTFEFAPRMAERLTNEVPKLWRFLVTKVGSDRWNPPLGDVVSDLFFEANRKVASRLGVDPHVAALVANILWGHGVTAEREARLEPSNTAKGTRSAQAAGHVTRRLVSEMEPLAREAQALADSMRRRSTATARSGNKRRQAPANVKTRGARIREPGQRKSG